VGCGRGVLGDAMEAMVNDDDGKEIQSEKHPINYKMPNRLNKVKNKVDK